MRRSRKRWSLVALSVAVAILMSAGAAQALIVMPTVNPIGGLFHYDYTITNDVGEEDVVLVDVFVVPFDLTLTSLFAPTGFQTIYDSPLGIVTFLPLSGSGALFRAGTSLSGFGFDSALPPGSSTFEALTVGGSLVTGPTQAPSDVPEPGSTIVLLLGFLGLAATRLGRR